MTTTSASTPRIAAFETVEDILEGRAVKRQQRMEDQPTLSSHNPYNLQNPENQRQSSSSRRVSGIRDYKPPLGPRAPDFSTKRLASAFPAPPNRLIPNPVSEPFLGLSARRTASTIETNPFRRNAQSRGVDGSEPQALAPTNMNTILSENQQPRRIGDWTLPRKGSPATSDSGNSNRRSTFGGPHSLTSSHSNTALRAAQVSSASAANAAMPPPSNSVRSRRQSYFPSGTQREDKDINTRQTRKSIGPGLITASRIAEIGNGPKSLNSNSSVSGSGEATVGRKISNPKPGPRMSLAPPPTGGFAGTSLSDSQKRALRTQSFQPPSRAQPSINGAPSPVSRTSSGTGPIQPIDIPIRQHTERLDTPSSSGPKRSQLSRTISPTDIKRSSRVSGLGVPQSTLRPTPSSTPDFTFGAVSIDEPPPTYFKPKTPPSSSATPEHAYRLSSARSPSSRASSVHGRPVSQQAPITSVNGQRPASVKSRNGDAEGSTAEMVPPVPAIPKAYESPSHGIDEPFFESFEVQNTVLTPLPVQVADHQYLEEDGPATRESKFRRRFTLGSRTNDQAKQPSTRHNAQQSRLPPLNLNPLSVQTTERIAALPQKTLDSGAGTITPTQHQVPNKVPTTPMTASRATFPTFDFEAATDLHSLPKLFDELPSLSHTSREPAHITSRTSSGTAFFTPSPVNERGRPQLDERTMSNANVAATALRHLPDRIRPPEVRPALEGHNAIQPSLEIRRKPSGEANDLTSKPESIQPQRAESRTVPASRGSLRRKLSQSLSFKRSSSKASREVVRKDDTLTDAKRDALNMPPPRMPLSKTRTEPNLLSTSMSSQQSLVRPDATKAAAVGPRKTSSNSALAAPNDLRHGASNADLTKSAGDKKSIYLSPMQRFLSSRNGTPSDRPVHAHRIDVDDAAAEEEMRRLASKRKEFEAAAREVEELRKRATAKERVSPGQATRAASLNMFEKGEVIDYPDIYFCGTKEAKKNKGDLGPAASNFGYDDERGDYNIVEGDHLAYRYEVVDILGKGSFGQVVRCVDHKTGKLVAIKIIRNKKRFHQQALVEVNILQRLREWDPQDKHCMINFTQSFYFRGHLCIATELLGINLYEFIKAHDFRGFSLKLIRSFTRQMLSCLVLLQGKRVIHCDLKPENILLAHPLHSEIKTIDFGSSCFDSEKVYTYIQSRFYRSPEVILGMDYGMPIDMWSMGCILAELYTGYPIFPGENEQEQLACIMEVFGPPEKHLIEKSSRKKVFFDSLGKPRMTVSSKGKRRRPSSKTLQQAIKCDDEAFLDFLTKSLRWDPERRMKPDEAMRHDFITGARTRMRVPPGTSPAKRTTTTSRTPSRTRPLPEPPATSLKIPIAASTRGPTNSPVKTTTMSARRQSTMNVTSNSNGVKRNSNGAVVGSSLPRSVSGKPDLAFAAAAASLRNR